MPRDTFKDALGEEAYGVFGRTGLTPSQLADGLQSCQETRESWVDGYTKLRDALRKITELVDSKADDPLDDAISIAAKALD
jgi:hypothetical protein